MITALWVIVLLEAFLIFVQHKAIGNLYRRTNALKNAITTAVEGGVQELTTALDRIAAHGGAIEITKMDAPKIQH